jgi:hypothetical protein
MFQKLAASLGVGVIVAACSGGPGPSITPGPSTDRASSGPEGATGGAEGATGSNDPGGCLACSGYYQCVGSIEGQDISGGSTLQSNSPSCPPTQNNKNDGVYFACGGSIVSGANVVGLPPNSVVGKWTDVGEGTINACIRVDGMDECITCTPSTEPINTPDGNNGNDGGRGVSQLDAG